MEVLPTADGLGITGERRPDHPRESPRPSVCRTRDADGLACARLLVCGTAGAVGRRDARCALPRPRGLHGLPRACPPRAARATPAGDRLVAAVLRSRTVPD